MSVTDKEVKDFETEYKACLFDRINLLCSSISAFENSQKSVGINESLPNMGITLHNKLIELSHIFQDAGLSLYSSKVEDYGPLNLNFVTSSFIGEAIIFNMIDKVEEGTATLVDYTSSLEEMSRKKREEFQSLRERPLKRFLWYLKNFQLSPKEINSSYTKEEIQTLNSHLSKYAEADNQLWTYNIRDNIIPSLVGYIKQKGYSKEAVPGLLQECIVSDLQKLGLADLLPQLEEQLAKSFEEELYLSHNSWDLSPEEKLKMQEEQQQIAQKYNLDLENLVQGTPPIQESQEEVK